MRLGNHECKVTFLPSKGTQRDAVISFTLFNVATIGLARKLQRFSNIRHYIYADDVTIWKMKGNLGKHNIIETYSKGRGLPCYQKI